MGWNEERAAWGSPVPSLKFRQGVVRPTLTPIPHQALDGRRGRGGEEEMEVHTGKKKPAGTGALLAKATEGDKPKVIPVF